MKKTFYVTTPIYYPSDKNGRFHIGTAYTSVVADFLNRYKKICGYDTRYLTGADEHGQKILEVAKAMNRTPQEHVDFTAGKLKNMFKVIDVEYDDFIRTTENRHKEAVQKLFEKLLAQDDIYLGEYEGDYCVACETYFTKTQLVNEKDCPDCGKATQKVKEESYFLRLSKYADKLLKFIKENPNFIQPKTRENEVVSFIKGGLQDLCVSRTSIDWGIQVPSNPKHVVYVWLDALSNYITALGYSSADESLYEKYWLGDEVVHVIGKDILRFHAVYWPIMLMALDLPITFKLFAHNWYMMKDGKMSKSKGNVIYPEPLVERYSSDAVRYYLLNELTLGGDGVFAPDSFVERFNSNLVNDLSNLVNRTVAMANKYQSGRISEVIDNSGEFEIELVKALEKAKDEFVTNINNSNISEAMKSVWTLVRRSNKYIDQTEPWIVAKDEKKKDYLNTILFHLAEMLRNIAILIQPAMPNVAEKIFAELGIKKQNFSFDEVMFIATNSYQVTSTPKPIFMRLDMEKEVSIIKDMMPKSDTKAENKSDVEVKKEEFISIDDFFKAKIVVGEIKSSEKHPKADRLLVNKVDIGDKEVQIVSGIAMHFDPNQLVEKKVLVVSNLKPVNLRGVLSEGMILAASDAEKTMLDLPTVDIKMPNGSDVK